MAGNRVLSSISRLCEHRMVPPDVCDAKQPVLGPSGGPEIDVTVAASPPLSPGLDQLDAMLDAMLDA